MSSQESFRQNYDHARAQRTAVWRVRGFPLGRLWWNNRNMRRSLEFYPAGSHVPVVMYSDSFRQYE